MGHKIKNRTYKCQCGFEFHRNGVGSINICELPTLP
ncbi:zinc ribbon domain-containing protein [Nostoc sp. UIC 10607]